MDDIIQLAAYVLFFIIVGGAATIKKIIEARERRRKQEQLQPRMKTTGMRPPIYERSTQPAPAEPLPREVETVREEDEPRQPESIDLGEILRKTFGIPVEIKNITKPKSQEEYKRRPAEFDKQMTLAVAERTELPTPARIETVLSVILTKEPLSGWQRFMSSLQERDLSDIQKVMVLSELFNKPPALRHQRNRIR